MPDLGSLTLVLVHLILQKCFFRKCFLAHCILMSVSSRSQLILTVLRVIHLNNEDVVCVQWKIQFSRSVVSDSLRPSGRQHTRLPCPSPTPGVCSDSCPSSWWCHTTISSSVIPCSSCLPSFPASRSFPMSQSLHYVAKLSELQVQHQSFQWIFRNDFL